MFYIKPAHSASGLRCRILFFKNRLVVLMLQKRLIYEIKQKILNTKGSPCPILRFCSHAAGRISAAVIFNTYHSRFMAENNHI